MGTRPRRHREGRRPSAAPVAVAAVAFAATVAGLVVLWPREDVGSELQRFGVVRDVYDAEVTGVSVGPCQGTGPDSPVQCQSVGLRLLQGPDRGEAIVLEFPVSPSSPQLQDGDRVVLGHQADAEPGFEYVFVDRHRKPVLLALAAVFALAVVLLGRLRGVAALAGLGATFVVLLEFVLPAILEGSSPLLVSIVGASTIAFLALYLSHGFTLMTTVALLGTLGSLALTAVLATVFVGLAEFTGLVSDEAALVSIGAARLDIEGLLLGGVVIGALGAIDDMTVTQASAVWELRAARPDADRGALFRSGLRIGRDHVASTVNTLVLAYAGASMPLLLLFVLSHQSLGVVANGEVVATEIVRTLVGSIGLVASVPFTTWLAARSAPAAPKRREPVPAGRPGRRRADLDDDRWPFED